MIALHIQFKFDIMNNVYLIYYIIHTDKKNDEKS
jgi:hypothetical protein